MESTMDEVLEYIKNTSPNTDIFVGCDSKQSGKHTIFVTVVVAHIDGNKGGKVFHFIDRVPRIKSLKWRLLQETHYSTGKALEILPSVGDRKLEVHLDYHPSDKNKSNMVVKEAIGYVIGQGLEYQLKPYAHAASSAADFLGRHGGRFKAPFTA
jgi:predicted RNase H-related nuclease YkuK (DUF458 family)